MTTQHQPEVRVLVVDDAPIIREALAAFLRAEGLTVVGTAPDPAGAIDAVVEHQPQVVLLDVRMPPTFTDEGIEVAAEIRRRRPGTGIVLITQDADGDPLGALLARLPDSPTGLAFVRKEDATGGNTLTDSIRRVAAGGLALDPALVEATVRIRAADLGLTAREKQVLALMAAGASNRGIASELGLSIRTVESNVSRIFERLGLLGTDESVVNRRVAAVLAYLSRGGASL